MDFIKLTKQLPPANKLVLVNRKDDYYLAYRQNKPLTINADPSKDCFWRGGNLDQLNVSDDTIFNSSFSDTTVLGWCHVRPVIDKAEKWETLHETISEYYLEPGDEGYDPMKDENGLLGIGEDAARAFGFM